MLTKRKWGWYLTLFRCPWLCIKILKFDKGKSLSKQKHFHRNEWWFLLFGSGVFYNKEYYCVGKCMREIWCDRSISIPKGSLHYYKAWETTYILEVQYGERCEEEDIKRYN